MSSDADQKIRDALVAARDNVALLREWGAALDIDGLRADRKTRYAIERAFIAPDAAIRDMPASLLQAYGIPASMIAGLRNMLAHTYDHLLDERVILTIRVDLPDLDAALESARAALRTS